MTRGTNPWPTNGKGTRRRQVRFLRHLRPATKTKRTSPCSRAMFAGREKFDEASQTLRDILSRVPAERQDEIDAPGRPGYASWQPKGGAQNPYPTGHEDTVAKYCLSCWQTWHWKRRIWENWSIGKTNYGSKRGRRERAGAFTEQRLFSEAGGAGDDALPRPSN